MKKAVVWFLIMILSVCSVPVFADDGEKVPEISAEAAILMQESTGRVLFEKNADKKLYPASTTKVMTALLAIENLDLTQVLIASDVSVQIDRDGSNMGILAGEQLNVEQLLYGLLLASANDAANVLAEGVSGSVSSFVELMNQRAADLGMTNTHFMNPHGYHDPEHYTTARDMAVLCAKAMENELFREIVATPQYEIPPTNRYKQVRYLSSGNALINPNRGRAYLYDGAKGIKTGHTSDAGYCLTSYAERKGLGFISVVLKSTYEYPHNYSFLDTIALLDYGFTEFALHNVADVNEIVSTHDAKWAKGGDQVLLTAKTPLEVLLPKAYSKELLTTKITVEEKIKAPVSKGAVLGNIEYFYDGESVGSVELIASKDVARSSLKMVFGTLWSWIFNAWVMTPLAIVVAILLLRKVIEENKKKKARQKRRQDFRRELDR